MEAVQQVVLMAAAQRVVLAGAVRPAVRPEAWTAAVKSSTRGWCQRAWGSSHRRAPRGRRIRVQRTRQA